MISRTSNLLLLGLCGVILLWPSASACTGQSSAANSRTGKRKSVDWRAQRIVLNREFRDDLQQLVLWCRENGLSDQIAETTKVYRDYGLDRQYIFLPSEKSMPTPPDSPNGKWLEKLNDAKRVQAARLFELAKQAADANQNAIAFQLLHEVIFLDRDHEAVRKILGHKKQPDGTWKLSPERFKIRQATAKHDHFDWAPGTYFVASTTYFQIDSNASKEETELLARRLEQWHYVWRQVFFEYWTSSGLVKKWLGGKGGWKQPRQKFRIVFFRDHADYLTQLSSRGWGGRGIVESSGFYFGQENVSCFPATDSAGVRDESTWRHELAHQLFRESIRSVPNPFDEQFLWLDEGVALHFESLQMFDEKYATLGGFDSKRLQYARIRKMREGFHVPIQQLAEMDQKTFQTRSDIGMIYSESAGLVHMMMDSRNLDLQQPLVNIMKIIHKGRLRPGSFQRLLGRTFAELETEYNEFLKVSRRDVDKRIESPETREELSLPNADLSDESFEVLGECVNLQWLDLAGATLTKKRVLELKKLDSLRKLFLRRTSIEPGALKLLDQLASLQELDLSASSISDSDLNALLSLPGIESLQVANTRVTDAGLVTIAKMPSLRELDVRNLKLSPQALQQFSRARPNVQVVR